MRWTLSQILKAFTQNIVKAYTPAAVLQQVVQSAVSRQMVAVRLSSHLSH